MAPVVATSVGASGSCTVMESSAPVTDPHAVGFLPTSTPSANPGPTVVSSAVRLSLGLQIPPVVPSHLPLLEHSETTARTGVCLSQQLATVKRYGDAACRNSAAATAEFYKVMGENAGLRSSLFDLKSDIQRLRPSFVSLLSYSEFVYIQLQPTDDADDEAS